MKYKVEISGTPIKSDEMEKMIIAELGKKHIICERTQIQTITEVVMKIIYQINQDAVG